MKKWMRQTQLEEFGKVTEVKELLYRVLGNSVEEVERIRRLEKT